MQKTAPKQTVKKKTPMQEMRSFWILAKMASMQRLLPLTTNHFGSKNKIAKNILKRIYKHIILILCKKPLEKTPNIRQMRPFWILAKMASMQKL